MSSATIEAKQFTDTAEFHELRDFFERVYKHHRLDRELKEMNKVKAFYQNGEVNELFKAFMHGYQLGRTSQ
jgi:hypothetical protein